ncbi:hypothetical protein Hanom_Chr09g00774851 [Helianthus anomalus]
MKVDVNPNLWRRIWISIDHIKQFVSDPKPKHPCHVFNLQSRLWDVIFFQPRVCYKHFLHYEQF